MVCHIWIDPPRVTGICIELHTLSIIYYKALFFFIFLDYATDRSGK